MVSSLVYMYNASYSRTIVMDGEVAVASMLLILLFFVRVSYGLVLSLWSPMAGRRTSKHATRYLMSPKLLANCRFCLICNRKVIVPLLFPFLEGSATPCPIYSGLEDAQSGAEFGLGPY